MSRNNESKPGKKWLEEGYKQFAFHGPEQLSINNISKEVGASRASFYYHFGDMDVFKEELLQMHWRICEDFHRDAQLKCRKLIPDLYNELAKHPIPLQFHLHLFHNRHIPDFNYLFIRTFESGAKSFALKLFKSYFDLKLSEAEIYNLWLTLGEAWYSRLDPNDLSAKTLCRHGEEIMRTVRNFINSELFETINSTDSNP
ncbi:MAG: TetR/AcrR family transcriptional regulator [Cyclobacteriaceae bacterium]